MSTSTPTLDDPASWPFSAAPFFAETCELLRCVRDHDFDTLADLCDDDFGIIDLDTQGQNVPVRSRPEWERWFTDLFAQLEAMPASTDSDIVDYQALEGVDLGYSVLEFDQKLTVGAETARFRCIATIIWKSTVDGWRESRWHCSLIEADIPEALTGAGV